MTPAFLLHRKRVGSSVSLTDQIEVNSTHIVCFHCRFIIIKTEEVIITVQHEEEVDTVDHQEEQEEYAHEETAKQEKRQFPWGGAEHTKNASKLTEDKHQW